MRMQSSPALFSSMANKALSARVQLIEAAGLTSALAIEIALGNRQVRRCPQSEQDLELLLRRYRSAIERVNALMLRARICAD